LLAKERLCQPQVHPRLRAYTSLSNTFDIPCNSLPTGASWLFPSQAPKFDVLTASSLSIHANRPANPRLSLSDSHLLGFRNCVTN
jgi:hypothetical protein